MDFSEELSDLDRDNEVEIDEIPFDELERDGFVVEGENDEHSDEPLYLEKVDNEPLQLEDMAPIEEVEIETENGEDKLNKEDKETNDFVFEESLEDIVDESEEDKFFVEPIE